MHLRNVCASLLILTSVLAGAPAASAATLSGPVVTTGDFAGMVATGVSTDGRSWTCRYLGLFC